MTIGAGEVRHVAALAELAVPDAEVAQLAAQLDAIVNFVAQLDELAAADAPASVAVGPERVELREDVVRPIAMTRTPAEMAPAFQQGFYVVPRLGGMVDD